MANLKRSPPDYEAKPFDSRFLRLAFSDGLRGGTPGEGWWCTPANLG